jgi:hypothetical protein
MERLWPDDDPRYRLRVWYLKGSDGRPPAVVGVEMWGVTPPGHVLWDDDGPGLPSDAEPITADAIRLPLGRLLDEWVGPKLGLARATLGLAARGQWGDDPDAQTERVERFETGLSGRRTGRPPLSDEFLQRVATVYREAKEAGNRAPALAVADALDANTPETARSWIKRARRRGILPPASHVHPNRSTRRSKR